MPLFLGPDFSASVPRGQTFINFRLFVGSTVDGVATVTSDVSGFDFPASVVISGGRGVIQCRSSAQIAATMTVTLGADSATCSVNIIFESQGVVSGTDLWTIPDDNLTDPVMFLGDAEQGFSKQIAEELMEKVVNQLIFYYPVDVEASSYHDMYGESIQKKFHPPIRVHALVEWKGYDTKNASFSLDKVPVIEVHFAKRRLEEDQNLVVKEGDFVKYGRDFYEITALNENSELFGAFDNKLEVSATCVKARKGTFFVKDQSQP